MRFGISSAIYDELYLNKFNEAMCKESCAPDFHAQKAPSDSPESIFYACGVSQTSHYKDRLIKKFKLTKLYLEKWI